MRDPVSFLDPILLLRSRNDPLSSPPLAAYPLVVYCSRFTSSLYSSNTGRIQTSSPDPSLLSPRIIDLLLGRDANLKPDCAPCFHASQMSTNLCMFS